MKERVGKLAAGAMMRVRTWFDPPLDADARPLEIREAILDAVERRVEPAGGGRRVLPFKYAVVTVLGESPERRAALEAALSDLQPAVEQRLAELRCERPAGFRLRLEVSKRPKSAWMPGQRFAIDSTTDLPEPAPAPERAQVPILNAVVVRGTAARTSYALSERQIRIGRTENPVDASGRPRHNHIVFLEDGDEHSSTVGRSHASIRFHAETREYRLFDDGSHNGTRIIREGRVVEVTPRDPVGVTLMSGDEIVLGTAALRIRLADPQ